MTYDDWKLSEPPRYSIEADELEAREMDELDMIEQARIEAAERIRDES